MVPDAKGGTTPDGTGRNHPCSCAEASGLYFCRHDHTDTVSDHRGTLRHNPRYREAS